MRLWLRPLQVFMRFGQQFIVSFRYAWQMTAKGAPPPLDSSPLSQEQQRPTVAFDKKQNTRSNEGGEMIGQISSVISSPHALVLADSKMNTEFPENTNDLQGLEIDFKAYLDSFLKTQNSVHTRRAYEKDILHFLEFIQFRAPTHISPHRPLSVHLLVDYREFLSTQTSARTGSPLSRVSINRKIATLRSFLNWLVLNGVLLNNPAKAVKSFRAGRESPTRDIPNDRVAQMLKLPARHKISGRMHYAILMILFHLGLRRAELVDLRTSDFFEQEAMRVVRVRGKGDKERILPLPIEVAKSIDVYMEMAKKSFAVDEPLFSPVKNNVTKIKSKPLHPNAIAYIVQHYAKLAGISYRVSPHSARATAVSNALDHAAPHRSVQYMAGWSSPLMVTRYDKRKQELRNSATKYVDYSDQD